MHLVSVSVDSIQIGQPLPFPLMDKDGLLLAKKSFVVPSREALTEYASRGGGLFIDVSDAEAHHRSYVDRLQGMVRQNKALGEIAVTQIASSSASNRSNAIDERPDWLDLQVQCNGVLREENPSQFLERLDKVCQQLEFHARRNPDGTLFALIHLSSTERRWYSATHAMLVSEMCCLAAHSVLNWPLEVIDLVRRAALTMNVSMTHLQDRLASQTDPLSDAQRLAVAGHAEKSTELLKSFGVTSPVWLEAVRYHHTKESGPLRTRSPALRVARLIQRADMFAAQLAPREYRPTATPAAAMQACYLDENRQPDEAGTALIKAVGIYQPGSFVRLATDEIAVVIKRGINTTAPKVAVLVNRSGIPVVEPILRDTTNRDWKVVASVPQRDVKVRINLEKILPLTIPNASDRPW